MRKRVWVALLILSSLSPETTFVLVVCDSSVGWSAMFDSVTCISLVI